MEKLRAIWDESKKILSISNHGFEISKEEIPFLFNRFYRTDDSRSLQIAGSGLGLAIVKQLADLQHINYRGKPESNYYLSPPISC
jgi:signal transduction histidine kinase